MVEVVVAIMIIRITLIVVYIDDNYDDTQVVDLIVRKTPYNCNTLVIDEMQDLDENVIPALARLTVKNGKFIGLFDPEQNIVEDEDEESNNNGNSIFDFFSKEGFSDFNNTNEFSVRNNSVLKMDLLLRSVLYACLFYLLAHPDTLSSVAKNVPGVKKANSLLVMMGVFFLVYYILNLLFKNE